MDELVQLREYVNELNLLLLGYLIKEIRGMKKDIRDLLIKDAIMDGQISLIWNESKKVPKAVDDLNNLGKKVREMEHGKNT